MTFDLPLHPVLVCGCLLLSLLSATVSEPVSFCLIDKGPDELGNVTLTCPPDETIVFDEALLGTSQWGSCLITTDDCVEKTKIFDECDGLNNCTRLFKTFSSKCERTSTVLILSYSCAPSLVAIVKTTPPVSAIVTSRPTLSGVEDGGSYGSEGDPQPGNRDDGSDDEDIGLIIGCAVAAVVTIIMLLIAIIMVIRRLLQYYSTDKPDDQSKIVICMNSVCVKMDKLPCFSPSSSSSGGGQGHMKTTGSESGSDTELNKLSSAGPRVAPVGEECNLSAADRSRFETCPTAPPLEESRDNRHLTATSADVEAQRHLGGPAVNVNVVASGSQVSKNNAAESKNCPDKMSSWRKKGINNGSSSCDSKNNNNISPCGQEGNVSKFVPKYDAVAIPNTESGTGC
ncbi:uncharacterized protein LOC101854661 isoform X2 [Aplysia californica]|uniref:Uncharacterized protein LOC101854661 isoform X2 n=1 Tax=Aplysia californica TaxID=6500 RepID=A0ABM0K0K4_APLCA|nr:uncharacterized protein LOC101854661 isoform X2 [Aplysia californica]